MNDEGTRQAGPVAERELFTRLVRDHYSAALRYAYRLLHGASDAEDAVQEAFAEAFTGLHTLRTIDAAPAWLRSIVHHRCLRRLRRRDLELVAIDETSDLATDAHLEHERRTFVASALASLPQHEREIVLLFYLKECSQQEVASFLGLPLTTVNNRLHDARRRMQRWENHMHHEQNEMTSEEARRVSRVGTLVSKNGPIVEARFDPDAAVDLFDAVVVAGAQGKPLERMKVAHRLGEGRVHCLLTSHPELPLEPGVSLLNTGKLTPATEQRVAGVSSETLRTTVDALRIGSPTRTRILETGIKAVDLLCPITAGGVTIQVGTSGVGRVVLLDELALRLQRSSAPLTLLCLVDRAEPEPYRGWDESGLRGSVADTRFYWALADHGTDPELPALDAADSVLYLSPLTALARLYPALDPEHSRSRALRPEVVGHAHSALAARAREALIACKRAEADPVLLELLAMRAYGAARRRLEALEREAGRSAPIALERARKLRAFLSQPFGVASEVTGWPGVTVALSDTLDGCRAILDGEVDELPTAAFAYAGTLEDVREHARSGVARVHR